VTLDEMKAAGVKAANIEHALERLKKAEWTLALVNKYAAANRGSQWNPELRLDKGDGYYDRPVTIHVAIPHEIVMQQAINAVVTARRAVVQAGGELPTASEQVQRGRQ